MTMIEQTLKVLSILPKSIRKILWPIFVSLFYWFEKGSMLKFYSNFVSPGDLVFDVGAHIGRMTEVFLSLGARVVCVEPVPHCIKILKKKFGNNDNVKIVEKGLSDREGKLTFYICEKRCSFSTFSEKYKPKITKKIQVPVTTLDLVIEKFGKPKFCKIDVEGFELQVLRGLSSKICFMSFEFTEKLLEDTKFCIDHILCLGKAKFNFSFYNQFKLTSKKWLNSKQLLDKLESEPNKYLWGDIYVKLE